MNYLVNEIRETNFLPFSTAIAVILGARVAYTAWRSPPPGWDMWRLIEVEVFMGLVSKLVASRCLKVLNFEEYHFLSQGIILLSLVFMFYIFVFGFIYLYKLRCVPTFFPAHIDFSAIELYSSSHMANRVVLFLSLSQVWHCNVIYVPLCLAFFGKYHMRITNFILNDIYEYRHNRDLLDEYNSTRQVIERFEELWFLPAAAFVREHNSGTFDDLHSEISSMWSQQEDPWPNFQALDESLNMIDPTSPVAHFVKDGEKSGWVLLYAHDLDVVTEMRSLTKRTFPPEWDENVGVCKDIVRLSFMCVDVLCALLYPFPEFGEGLSMITKVISYHKMLKADNAREISNSVVAFHTRYYGLILRRVLQNEIPDAFELIPTLRSYVDDLVAPKCLIDEVVNSHPVHWACQAKMARTKARSNNFSLKSCIVLFLCCISGVRAAPSQPTTHFFSCFLSVIALVATMANFIDWRKVGSRVVGAKEKSRFEQAVEAARLATLDIEAGFYECKPNMRPESKFSDFCDGFVTGQVIAMWLRMTCVLFVMPFNVVYCLTTDALSIRPSNWWNPFDPNPPGSMHTEATPLSLVSELSPALGSLMEKTETAKGVALGLMVWTGYPTNGSRRDKFIFVSSTVFLLSENLRDSLLKDRVFQQLSMVFDLGDIFSTHRDAAVSVFRRMMRPESDDDELYGKAATWKPPSWLGVMKESFETGCGIQDSTVARKARDFLAYLSALLHLNWHKLDYTEFERIRMIAHERLGREPSLRSFLGSTIATFEFAAAARSLGVTGAFNALEYGNKALYSEAAELNRMLVEGEIGLSSGVSKIEAVRRISFAHERALSELPGLRGIRRKALESQICDMKGWMRSFNVAISADTVNAQPFAFTLAGPAGVGKSTSLEVLGTYLHELAGLSEFKSVGVISESDKYDTGLSSANTMIVGDDFGNIKTELAETPVQSHLLRFNSTVRVLLIKADLAEKGVHYANHLFFAVTSNSWHAGTVGCTISPASAARRLGKKIWMDYKEGYANVDGTLNKEKVAEDFGVIPPGVMPPWATYSEYVIIETTSGVKRQITRQFKDGEECLASFRDDYYKHEESVKSFKTTADSQKTMKLCKHKLPTTSCSACNMKPEIFDRLPLTVRLNLVESRNSCTRIVSDLKISVLRLAFHKVWQSTVGDELIWTLDSLGFEWFIRLSLLMGMFAPLVCGPSACSLFTCWVFACLSLLFDQFLRFGREFCSASSAAVAREIIIQRARSSGCVLAKITTVGYLIAKLPWLYQSVVQNLLSLAAEDKVRPTEFVDPSDAPTLDEVKVQLKEEPVWQQKVANLKPVSKCSVGATWEQVESLIMHNVARMKVRYHDGQTSELNVLFLNTALIVMPAHVWYKGAVKAAVLDINITTLHDGRTIAWRVHESTTFFRDDCAISMMTAVAGMRDLSKFLPEGRMPDGTLAKRPVYDEGIWKIQTVRVKSAVVEYKRGEKSFKFNGYTYRTPERTATGHCGVPIVTFEGGISIIGFHVCGNGSSWITGSTGGAYPLTKELWSEALTFLKQGIYVNPPEIGEIKTKYHTKQIELNYELHRKNVLNFVNNELDIVGDVGKVSSSRSNVEVSPLSRLANQYVGPPPPLGVPDMSSSKSFRPVVFISSSPKSPMDHKLLQDCVDDYIGDIPTLLSGAYERYPILKRAGPYSLEEVMNGVDGHPYLFSLAVNKSAGPPFHHSTERLMDVYPDGTRSFKDFNKLEFNEIMVNVINGRRSGTYASAHVKSEPRPAAKLDSARAFFAQSKYVYVATVQYFGPPMHVILSKWKELEHCLGVNPCSSDWQYSTQHLFDECEREDNCFSIDYSKFDMTMQLDLRTAMTKIFIDVAREMGYSQSDLEVMEMISDEWLRPIVSFDGALVLLSMLMISGTFITAMGNSIDNSLLIRYSFFQHFPRERLLEQGLTFRDFVRLRILGDDNAGSQSRGFDKWNLTVLKADLQKIGVGITSGDKTDNLAYIKPGDVEFLKRTTWYNPDLKCRVGCLKPGSILKPLHFFERSRYVHEQLSNILMGAVNETFLYGRDNFEKVCSGIRKIAEEANLPVADILGDSYEERVARFLSVNESFEPSSRDTLVPPPLLDYEGLMLPEATITTPDDMNMGTEQTVIAQRNSEPQQIADGEPTPITLDYVHTPSTDLGHWMNREVLVSQLSFSHGDDADYTVDPLAAVMSQASFKDKIKNIMMGRWDIEVRFVVAASSGHYGSFRAYAIPKPQFAQNVRGTPIADMDAAGRNLYSSQLRHIDMLIGRDAEATLTLPFISMDPMALMSTPVFSNMWELRLFNTSKIQHAIQPIGDPILVKVYASLRNATFTGATWWVAEAGNEMGEVEAGATALATTAGLMSSALRGVPTLSSAAAAVSAGAGVAAGVARAHGWSRPISHASTRGMPSLTGPLVNTNTDIYSRKLAPDVNQGVTVPGNSYGDPYDDVLATENFLGKWNHIDTLAWTSDMADRELLETYDVTPNGLVDTKPGGVKHFGIPTAAIYGLFHKFWSGSVSFRFTVSAHPSMGGSLIIVYDPYLIENDYNAVTQQTAVYSIRDRTEMIVTIHWDSPSVALRTHANSLTEVKKLNETRVRNGIIGVFVDSKLVGSKPSDSGFEVGILVDIRAEPNCLWFDYSPGMLAQVSLPVSALSRDITNKPGEPFPGKLLPEETKEFKNSPLELEAKAEVDYTSGLSLCCESEVLPPTTTFTPGPVGMAPPKDTSVPSAAPVTLAPSTLPPSTAFPSTQYPTTLAPTTAQPTTMTPTSLQPTTTAPTTQQPTTVAPSTLQPSTMSPTTMQPTTLAPTTLQPSTANPTTQQPSTQHPTTGKPTQNPTTGVPTPTPIDYVCQTKHVTFDDTWGKLVVQIVGQYTSSGVIEDPAPNFGVYDLDYGFRHFVWSAAKIVKIRIPFYSTEENGTVRFRFSDATKVNMTMVGGTSSSHSDPDVYEFNFNVGPTHVVKRGELQWITFNTTYIADTYLEAYETSVPLGLSFYSYTPEGYGGSLPLGLPTYTKNISSIPVLPVVCSDMPVGDVIPGCFAELSCSPTCFATCYAAGGTVKTTGTTFASFGNLYAMAFGASMDPTLGVYGFIATAAGSAVYAISVLKEDGDLEIPTPEGTFAPEADDVAPTDAHFTFNSYSDRSFVSKTNAGENCFGLRPLLKIYTHNYTVEATSSRRIEKCIYSYDNNNGRVTLYKLLHHSFLGSRGSMNFLYHIGGEGAIVAGRGSEYNDPNREYVTLGGFEMTDTTVNSTLAVTVPYYNPGRYTPNAIKVNETDTLALEDFIVTHNVWVVPAKGSAGTWMREFFSVGEDFQLAHWIGFPFLLVD